MRTTTSAAAGLVLLAGLLAGCGGDGEGTEASDAVPTDATEKEFCEGYAGLFERMGSMDPSDTKAGIEAVKGWADDMKKVGTPADIPDAARQGFTVVVDSLRDIDSDATQKELSQLGSDMSEGDQKSGEAFIEYATKTCPDAMKSMLGDLQKQQGDLGGELGELEDEAESPAG